MSPSGHAQDATVAHADAYRSGAAIPGGVLMSQEEPPAIGWRDHVGAINLLARFVLELAILVALAAWGWRATDSTPLAVALAIGAPVAWAIIWGMLVAPKAPRRMPDPARLVFELVLFAVVAVLLVSVHLAPIGIALAAAAALNSLLMIPFGQRGK